MKIITYSNSKYYVMSYMKQLIDAINIYGYVLGRIISLVTKSNHNVEYFKCLINVLWDLHTVCIRILT